MNKEEYYLISEQKKLPLRCPILNYCGRRALTMYAFNYRDAGSGNPIKVLKREGAIPEDFEQKEIPIQGEAVSWMVSHDSFLFENACPEVALFDNENRPVFAKQSACASGSWDNDNRQNKYTCSQTKHYCECSEFSYHEYSKKQHTLPNNINNGSDDYTIKNLPNFNISQDEKKWLEEVWSRIKETGFRPKYKSIKKDLLDIVDEDFDPLLINEKLLKNSATEITLLGVLLISENVILNDIEKIFFYIKKELRTDLDNTKFTIEEIAAAIDLDEKYTRIIFHLMSDYRSLYRSAGSRSHEEGVIGIDNFDVDGGAIDTYLKFKGIVPFIESYFENYKNTNSSIAEIKALSTEKFWFTSSGHIDITNSCFNRNSQIVINTYIDHKRIVELLSLKSDKWDFLKLLRLCKEININYHFENYYSVIILVRALIDHIPRFFEYKDFSMFLNHYQCEGNVRSFKESMERLDKSLRKIADSYIHSQIRVVESTLNETQINFKNELDVLLAEIVRVQKK